MEPTRVELHRPALTTPALHTTTKIQTRRRQHVGFQHRQTFTPSRGIAFNEGFQNISNMSSIPTEIAETIQTGHIAKNPDPVHDNAPATAAEKREPVSIHDVKKEDYDIEGDYEEDIPYSVLRPEPRTHKLPPLPDLRFEQSYLHSISKADTWWKIGLITVRDQVWLLSVHP